MPKQQDIWIDLTGFDSGRKFHVRADMIDGVGEAPDAVMVDATTEKRIHAGATQVYCRFGRLQVKESPDDVMNAVKRSTAFS